MAAWIQSLRFILPRIEPGIPEAAFSLGENRPFVVRGGRGNELENKTAVRDGGRLMHGTPQYRNSAAALGDLGLSNFLLGNYDKSIQYLTEAATTQPDYVRSRQRLVASLEAAGRPGEARTELEELKKIQPTLSLDYINTTYPFESDGDRERFINALRRAGLK